MKSTIPTLTFAEIAQIVWQCVRTVRKAAPEAVVAYRTSCGWPELDYIRREICLCLVHDMNQASITLSNLYLEALISSALIRWRSVDLIRPSASTDTSHIVRPATGDADSVQEKYSTMRFEKKLREATELGILSPEDQRSIRQLRTAIRNPYAHAMYYQLFGTATIEKVNDTSAEAKPSPKHKIINDPIAHVLGQWLTSMVYALRYFLQLDAISKQIVQRVLAHAKQPSAAP